MSSKKNKNDKGTFYVIGEGKNAAITKGDWVPAEIYNNCVKAVVETAGTMFEQLNMTEDTVPATAALPEASGNY